MPHEPRRLRAEALREIHRIVDAFRPRARLLVFGRIHSHRDPTGVEACGKPARGPHDVHRLRVWPDADQEALGSLPRSLDRALAQVFDHLVVDPRRRAAQREFAQRREVPQREELLLRELGGLRQIDLAVLEALDQILGGDVHQHDVVGVAEDDVGHGLAHDDAGHARNDVGEALQMLNVERRPYVDAGAEQLLDVLPALGVAALRRVGVGEFVDDDQLGPAAERRIEIELLDLSCLDSSRRGAAEFRDRASAPPSRRGRGFRRSRRRRRRPPA